MTSLLSLTLSNIFTEENDAVTPIPQNIFNVPYKYMLDITEIHVYEDPTIHEVDQKSVNTGPDEVSLQILEEYYAQLENPIT